ncbi:MAG: radical SAM protein, partial [Candidatus Thorarchaeota archaeon]
SYCIVPRVRGPLVSFGPGAVIDEIRRLVSAGYHEVVLTAVHIGRYEFDGLDLAGLVIRILDETDLSRIRLSSLEPNELTDELLNMAANSPRVCRHLHLPLQSGSDRILTMMRRPYRRDDYLSVVRKIKTANPDITIGCDLIVGFPGETEEDFGASLEILDSGYIDYGHIFSYSDRPGTVAADLSDKIDPGIIKERNRRARNICGRHRQRQMKSQIGKTLGVISERTPNRSGGYNGVSDNYLKVHLPADVGGRREILRFLVRDVAAGHLVSGVLQR